jgi:hypothetical protein
MATVTPNFNWPVPTSTDLVKDGATAIEALGDSIDASLVDLKGGTTGQVLSKTSNTDMDFTWVTSDDANAIQNTIVDAKGDLIAASAADTPARLAVGNNGEVLVADSTSSTGLKWAKSGNFTGCRVFSTTAQSIANSTDTAVAFANESYDTDGFHSNVTNNNRITIPAGLGGYYRITANIGFATNGSGRRIFQLRLNGAGSLCAGEMTPIVGVEPTGTITDTFFFSAGDYIDLFIFQNSGGSLNTSGNSTRDFFEVQRVGS